MPLVSALAASHAPNILLEPGAEWEDFMNLHYSMAPQGSSTRPTLEQQKKLRKDAEDAFAVLRADMEQAKPDVLIVVANDQFVNFFWNNIPTFFVTIADEVKGQFTRHKFHYRNHKELGRAIVRAGMDKGIDLSFGEHIELQHTQNVPLYFLLPEPKIPILPIYVNTWVDPAPTPKRCYQVGELIREVATKSPSGWQFSPPAVSRIFPAHHASARSMHSSTTSYWKSCERVRGRRLVDYSVEELLQAGDTEFLNWMVVLGTVGDARASYTAYMPDYVATGWGFVSWKL